MDCPKCGSSNTKEVDYEARASALAATLILAITLFATIILAKKRKPKNPTAPVPAKAP